MSEGSVAEATVVIADDDTAGVTVSETSLGIEEGDFNTYTVVLDTEPVGDVTVAIGGIANTDLTLDKTTLTFTTSNWDTAQTVKVTAGQDDDAVDEEIVNIKHTVSSSNDTKYDGLSAGSVAVTVTDDDTAGVTISEPSLEIEEGDSETYTVVLDTEPAGSVMVTIGGFSGTDVSLDKTTLTFTTGNWDTAQTVRVTAEQDYDAIDEEVVNITHAVTSAGNSDYDGVAANNVPVTVTDDDTAGVTVSETSLEIEEGDFGYLHRGAGHRAGRQRHGDHGRHYGYRPDPRQDHAHLHHRQLGHGPDGEGDGGAGRRRRGRGRGHDHPHRQLDR